MTRLDYIEIYAVEHGGKPGGSISRRTIFAGVPQHPDTGLYSYLRDTQDPYDPLQSAKRGP